MPVLKRCTKCGRSKSSSEFSRHPKTKDGLQSWCKRCLGAATQAYLKTEKGKAILRRAQKRYFSSVKGKAALRRGFKKLSDAGYYRFGKGAISILRSNARRRSLAFNLTEETLTRWWNDNPDVCAYCGITIQEFKKIRNFLMSYQGSDDEILRFKRRFFRSPKHAAINWMTLDRTDNSRGYSVGDICKSCWICNSLKGEILTAKEMRKIAKDVMNRLRAAIANSAS
jgi:hypothetical protein